MQDEELSRKQQRSQKKRASKLDRSKFKKTDQKKWEEKQRLDQEQKLAKLDLEQGRILSITPEAIWVNSKQETLACSLGGLLKKEKTRHKNIVAVGDFVLFETKSKRIVSVQPRHSILSRQDNLRRQKQQIIATNIDQVLITVSVVSPPLKPPLIDRYLIAAAKGEMSPVIVINKIDLLQASSKEAHCYQETLALYRSLHIPVISVCVHTQEGLEELQKQMQNKASVFSGQSGVGKSSLINAMTGLNLPIGEMRKQNKGTHTTTSACLVPLPFGGWCIDTPGIRSFGVWDLSLDDLTTYFPDIIAFGQKCHFPNCSHTHEPNCYVIEAVEKKLLSSLRYESYLKLRQEVTQMQAGVVQSRPNRSMGNA